MAWHTKKLTLGKAEHIVYAEFLQLGETYHITISKRLLFRTFLPFWIELLFLFSVQNKVFSGYIVLPNLILYGLYAYMVYDIWKQCSISLKAYIFIHLTVITVLKILGIPFGHFLEALWILCI
jgi:hypothetical protein